MDEGLIRRIEREAGVAGLAEILGRMPATDLQSLLLEVQRRRVAGLDPADVLRRYEADRFARPSPQDAAALLEVERLAFASAPAGYERVALSPIGPLGVTAALTTVDQNWVVSTIRNTEVVSDSTSLLALEAARRRRAPAVRTGATVRLCTAHRVLRAQPFHDPGFRPHFGLFALVAAGRDAGGQRFESENLFEQVDFHVRFLLAAAERGFGVEGLRVLLTDIDGGRTPMLEERVIEPMAVRHPDVEFALDPDRERARGYYDAVCFEVLARRADGDPVSIVDGGFTDWTRRLLSDRKERLLTSGVGIELLLALFGPQDL